MHGFQNPNIAEESFLDDAPVSQEDPTWAAIAFWAFVMLTIAAVGFYGSVTA